MDSLTIIRDVAVSWAAALAGGYIGLRLKQPTITSYILAGVVIGPYGLGIIRNTENVAVLAELGVVLLLFILGVEVSVKTLFSAPLRTLAVPLTQILTTTVIAGGLARVFGLTPSLSGAFLFGFACAVSSTAVVTKMLLERSESDAAHGRLLVPMLLVQDLCLVPVVAVIPVLSSGVADLTPLVVALGKVIAFVIIVVFAAAKIIPGVLSRTAQANERELFLLTVICLCLGVALAADQLGLSLALGGFLAGVIISESPYGHQALAELIPMRDLFGTIFFVSVGMLLSPHFIATHALEVMLFVVLLCVGKALLGGLAAAIVLRSWWSATLVGVGIAQAGEFSFLLATMGFRHHLMSDSTYNLFFAGAVISLILSPWLMDLTPRVMQRLARRGKTFSERRAVARESDSHLEDHVILCGFGRIGRNIGRALKAHAIPFIVLELNAAIAEDLKAADVDCIYGDAFKRTVLLRAGLRRANCIVVTVPDPLATLEIVKVAREYNPGIIVIARAHRPEDIEIFRAAGANAVVQPEFEASIELTRLTLVSLKRSAEEVRKALTDIYRQRYMLFRPDIHEENLANLMSWDGKEFHGSWFSVVSEESEKQELSVGEIRRVTGCLVLAIRRGEAITPSPTAAEGLFVRDQFYAVGTPDELAECESVFGVARFCATSEGTSDGITFQA